MPKFGGGLSPKAKIFSELYALYGNGTRAAKEAGFKETAAKVRAVELLKDPRVQVLIAEWTNFFRNRRHQQLNALANEAIQKAYEILERKTPNRDDMAAVQLIKDLLDRAGHAVVQKTRNEHGGLDGKPIEVNIVSYAGATGGWNPSPKNSQVPQEGSGSVCTGK